MLSGERRKKTGLPESKASGTPAKKERKKAGLIRHLGRVEKKQGKHRGYQRYISTW